MGMKFLNKKGWHTGSLRNIENVWKAEQKQEAEQKKLEELRLQIVQERERSEFRALQEQAGLIPRQERLEFLYDSGLSVGKGNASSSGHGVSFQKEEQPLANPEPTNEKPTDQSGPGALFEDKAPSANDSWRKLHSDPLLMIRQREQEALARIKNNPVKMALIRKSILGEEKGKDKDGEHKKKHKRKHRKSRNRSDSEEDSGEERKLHRKKTSETRYDRRRSDSDDDEPKRREIQGRQYERRRRADLEDEPRRSYKHYERQRSDLDDEWNRRDKHYERRRSGLDDESRRSDKHYERRRPDLDGDDAKRRYKHHDEKRRSDMDDESSRRETRNHSPNNGQEDKKAKTEDLVKEKNPSNENQFRRRNVVSKLTEEERAARLKQMQMDAEVHEEQRWRRLKKADETDAVEANKNQVTIGKSFLDDANKSVYGIEKGGSSTIEESVRRRSYYSQRGNEAEGNAFRR